jgi:hypothetical protein
MYPGLLHGSALLQKCPGQAGYVSGLLQEILNSVQGSCCRTFKSLYFCTGFCSKQADLGSACRQTGFRPENQESLRRGIDFLRVSTGLFLLNFPVFRALLRSAANFTFLHLRIYL